MRKSSFLFKHSGQTINAAERKRAVPCPDVEHWGSAARPSGGKSAAPYCTGGAALKPREG